MQQKNETVSDKACSLFILIFSTFKRSTWLKNVATYNSLLQSAFSLDTFLFRFNA